MHRRLTRRSEASETIERCFNLIVCAGFRGGRVSLFSEGTIYLSELKQNNLNELNENNLDMFCTRTAAAGGTTLHAGRCLQAIRLVVYYWFFCSLYSRSRTSWIFGNSNSSEKTKTPGAEVASWMSFAAAAPLRDFAIKRKGSSFAEKFDPSSIVKVSARNSRKNL